MNAIYTSFYGGVFKSIFLDFFGEKDYIKVVFGNLQRKLACPESICVRIEIDYRFGNVTKNIMGAIYGPRYMWILVELSSVF